MVTGGGRSSAPDASVVVDAPETVTPEVTRYLQSRAEDTAAAVVAIEAKLAGVRETLAAAKSEAKQAAADLRKHLKEA